jgi:acetolactate decarboxylase
MMQFKDYASKIALAHVKSMGSTHAVGALSDLRGEITMIDGRFVVSYGGGCNACSPPHSETATLLATARVAEWSRPIALESALSGVQLEAFIVAQARAAGLDMTKPFPVRLKGNLTDVSMHVIEAPNEAFTGHGSRVHMAKQDDFRHATLPGEVVGMYAPPSMQGILSHPGDPFHFHWVDMERTRTAHLDGFGMEKGSELILPIR